MRSGHRLFSAVLIAGALASPAIVSGCYQHHDHAYVATWSDNEGPYYARWESETHRDHKEWRQRGSDEQKEYWSWRHDHP